MDFTGIGRISFGPYVSRSDMPEVISRVQPGCAGCDARNALIQRLVTHITRGNLPSLIGELRKDLAEATRLAGPWPGQAVTHPYRDEGGNG